MPADNLPVLQAHLQTDRFLQERLNPRPGDAAYLHLADLRQALEKFRTDAPLAILDFGCGCSPYRSLFPKAEYRRADFEGFDGIDYPISETGTIEAPDGYFDLVLSTQVLEHLADIPVYLKESWRVLKPGGKLICSTHGTFEDHACPYDFNRWTCLGLRRELERAGFEVARMEKLTTGPRAIIFCLDHFLPKMILPRNSLFTLSMKVGRRLWISGRRFIHRQSDLHLSDWQVVDEAVPGYDFYIALMAEAYKPR